MLKNKRISLQFKTVIYIILAVALSVGSYFLLNNLGQDIIDNVYMSEERYEMREDKVANEFIDFVQENDISSTDYNAIKDWCGKRRDLYLMVYTNEKLSFATDGSFSDVYQNPSEDVDYEYNVYTIDFKDTTLEFSIEEYSDLALYGDVNKASLGFAILLLIILILFYTERIVRKVINLSREVSSVSEDTRNIISQNGNDEFSDLRKNINNMRTSITEHFEKEKSAIEANNELITSISHDIRTPLTSIIGYSEIMTNDKVTDVEQIKLYANNCREKAYQLKNLTDQLFRYFLIYGNKDLEKEIEPFSASLLFQQLIGEKILYLSQNGYVVNCDDTIDEDFEIKTDVNLIHRVFDNVFSNIEKYADKEYPIVIKLKKNENDIEIRILNRISSGQTPESNKIGIKTSEKIMEQLGGSFRTEEKDNIFSVIIKSNS